MSTINTGCWRDTRKLWEWPLPGAAPFQQTLRLATAQGSQAPRSAREPRTLPIHGSHQGSMLISAHTQPCPRHILTLRRKWHRGSWGWGGAVLWTLRLKARPPLSESPRPGCQLPLDPARQVGCKHEHAIITAIIILRAQKWNQVNQEMAEEARAGRSQSSGTDLGPSLGGLKGQEARFTFRSYTRAGRGRGQRKSERVPAEQSCVH